MAKSARKKRNEPDPKVGSSRKLPVVALIGVLIAGAAYYQNFVRQPDLTLDLRVSTTPLKEESGVRASFEVSVENTGSKAADYFYWHLMIPVEDVVATEFKGLNNVPVKPTKEKDARGVPFFHFQGFIDRPLPGIGMTIGSLILHMRRPFNLRWQLTCCDDLTFPKVGDRADVRLPKLASIPVNPDMLKRWDVLKTSQTQ
jgi:hypothetical protein